MPIDKFLTIAQPAERLLARFAALVVILVLSACSGSSDSPGDTDAGDDSPSSADSGNENSGASNRDLGPLPSPSLSEGPSANDEPLPEGVDFTTATGFAVVRDPQAFPVSQSVGAFTEADFAAGLPDAVIERPAGQDPASNAAPFFEGLSNVRVNAGDTLSLQYVPRDPEGELPGMFPQELPDGASFDDNFDGTKTLNWQPLQGDIGIQSFTVVAVDQVDSRLRTSQPVLIAVDEPLDAAAVPNVAPELDTLQTYVVRQGDPVVIEMEGTDRNGTVPTLELPMPPAGATLLPRPFEPERFVLRFTPNTVGPLVIDVLVRDEVDSNLAGAGEIVLDVRAPEAFTLDGSRLRSLAAARGLEYGSAISPFFHRQADGALYQSIAADEFGIVTPESSMKMIAINPAPGLFAFAETDNLLAFARANDMQVRGHPLVWHRELPEWILATPAAEREGHMREFIARMLDRYADDIKVWDVINEPIADDGSLRESIWSEAMGEDYIDIAFRQVRMLDPEATLVLNEYDISFDGPKFDALLALVDRLAERGVPLDAIGFQLHLFASYDQYDELAAHMAAVAQRGLDVHITELDVALTAETDAASQATVYQRVIEICLEQPRCSTLQTWGFTDRYSFRSPFNPLPLDRDYQSKPAYVAIQEALSN